MTRTPANDTHRIAKPARDAANDTGRWTAIDSYRRDAIDAGEWLNRARKSRYDRICDWLGETYSGPVGFVWFAGTLLPIAAAMWAIGYFGVRELVGVL